MKLIEQDNVEFEVDEHSGFLKRIYNWPLNENIYIPRVLSDGTEIKSIGYGFCSGGAIGKLTIDSAISDIQAGAFMDADCTEVVWPDACNVIPNSCFKDSIVQRVTNIDHVTSVGHGAFANSGIVEIVWPSKCNIVPEGCFCGSILSKIENLEHIVEIEDVAFSKIKNYLKIDLSRTTLSPIISPSAFLASGCDVLLPYYASNNIDGIDEDALCKKDWKNLWKDPVEQEALMKLLLLM